MGTWEDELDLDLSDIWAAGSKPVQIETQQNAPEEEKDDDLAFPSQAPTQLAIQSETAQLGIEPETRVLGLEDENGVTRLLSENVVLNADVANAPTQVASLSAEPYVSRGGGATVPLATQHLQTDSRQRLPPLPSFQPVILREVPLPTPTLERLQTPVLRNPNLREKAPVVDIRKYFSHRGSSSGAGEGASRKKPRIPGPVGELFRKDQASEGDVVDGDVNAAFGSGKDDLSDRIFRKGAWIRALHSLNVEEFDPARYAILKVTASSIGTSRAQTVPHFVAVIKELTPNVFGDAEVVLKICAGSNRNGGRDDE